MAEEDCNQSTLNLPCDGIWKNSATIQDSRFLLASMCMWFIRLEDFTDSSIKREDIDQLVSKYEFFNYSAANWAVHFRNAVIPDIDSHPLTALSLELCTDEAGRYVSWKLAFWLWYGPYTRVDMLNNLHLASYCGLDFVVEQVLANPDIEVNAVNEMGETPLWYAASGGHEAVVGQLLAAPSIDVNAPDKSGETPLLSAARRGHRGVVRQLLTAPGININAIDEHGSTPLWWTAYKGDERAIGELLTVPGIEVNAANDDGETPLWRAVNEGHEGVVGQLLTAPSIDVNAANKNGETPLWQATYKRDEGVVGQLLTAPSIDVNAIGEGGYTALLWAASEGYEGIVGQLLAVPGINVNVVDDDDDGWTPLSIAQEYGHEGVIQLLESRGIMVAESLDMDST